MVGTNNGNVVSWEIESAKPNGCYSLTKDDEITGIISVDSSPYIWISNF